ncbi:MAG: 50S ribosomal protein L2 [Nanoarchaeota archaeon]|nr:MAG: 50S ribosomal protein L2 [Nanoarchaeota archaeon]
MGKNLLQQRRGKGSPTFRAPSFRYIGQVNLKSVSEQTFRGSVVELLHSQGHNAPIARIVYDDGEEVLSAAPLGIRIGDNVFTGKDSELKDGNTLPLSKIPEGTVIFNLEARPGDGGKFVRSSGGSARVVARLADKIMVELPSRKQRPFDPQCRATIGTIAGGGRLEKPLLKAGGMYHRARARNRRYPHVCALSMNAVDHPFGGSRSSKKGKSTIAPRFAPPGRKVGKIRPSRTGRRRS